MNGTGEMAGADGGLRVVDAHVHFYADDLAGAGSMAPYGVSNLRAEAAAAGVVLTGCVHVEAGRGAQWSIAESVRWHGSSDDLGVPTVLVAAVQLEDPDLAVVLDRQQRIGSVVGVRQMLDWHGGVKTASPLLLDPVWRRGLTTLAGRSLTFDLQVLPEQLRDATELVRSFPELQFVLNHGGLHVPWQQADLRQWSEDLQLLGRCANAAVKTSGFDTVDPSWQSRRVREYLAVLLDSFAPDRTLFASNFPIDRVGTDYSHLLEHHLAAFGGLDTGERDSVLRGNACRIYRIEE